MILAYIVIGVVVLLLVVAVYCFNRLVRLRNEVDTGWSNIDVQLKRRNDLIPNLVEAVKGYAAHERGVFDEVTSARAAMAQALRRPQLPVRLTRCSARRSGGCSPWRRRIRT